MKIKNTHILLAVAAIVIVSYFAQTSGLLGSLESAITPKPCELAPFASNCICDDSTEKYETQYMYPTRYICEPLEKILDPDSPTFTTDAIQYAQNMLSSKYPECDTISCDFEQQSIESEWIETSEGRMVSVECVDHKFNNIPWAVHFDIYEGSLWARGDRESIHCNSYVPATPEEDGAYARFMDLCSASVNNPYCAGISESSEGMCSVIEVFPDTSNTRPSRTYTVGVAYGFPGVDIVETFGYCGSMAKAAWDDAKAKCTAKVNSNSATFDSDITQIATDFMSANNPYYSLCTPDNGNITIVVSEPFVEVTCTRYYNNYDRRFWNYKYDLELCVRSDYEYSQTGNKI